MNRRPFAIWFVAALCAAAPACAVADDPSAAGDAPAVGSDGKADGYLVFDPARSYPDRVALLRHLEDVHPYPFAGTAYAWADQRDGYVAQTEWQLRSGRATRAPGGDTLWGWWPNVNYTLTAWQALALQDRGELGDVMVVQYLDAGRFAPSAAAEAATYAFYDELDRDRARAEAGQLSGPDAVAARAHLQELLWDLHETALHDGLARNEDVLGDLPYAERKFATAWGYTAVGILAAVNFPTTAELIEPLNAMLLPQRILSLSDLNPLASSDLPGSQRTGATALILLHTFESTTGHLVLHTMQNVATSPTAARRAAEAVLAMLRGESIRDVLARL